MKYPVVICKKLIIFMKTGLGEVIKNFSVELVHSAKPSELSFSAIIISMMVFIFCHQFCFTDMVDDLHLFHHMHWKRQVCNPGVTVFFVFKIKLCGGRILNFCCGAHVIAHFVKDIGLYATAKIKGLVVAFMLKIVVIAPDQGGCACTENICKLHRIQIGYRWCPENHLFITPAVSGPVEPEMHLAGINVNQVCAA